MLEACRLSYAMPNGRQRALEAADRILSELLTLAKSQKFDTAPRGDDINTYEGATGILYNKFLFRSG